MSRTVCLTTETLNYPQGGGHLWVSLNWALGLKALGCKVIWLEGFWAAEWAKDEASTTVAKQKIETLKRRLAHYGLVDGFGFFTWDGDGVPAAVRDGDLLLDDAAEADLLLDLSYGVPQTSVDRFRRSAVVDIDPGLLQVWLSTGVMRLSRYDLHFTIGETVGQPEARFPDCGITWHYTPPPVSLSAWPVAPASNGAPYTTVSGWWGDWVLFDGEMYPNGKRDSFQAYLELPRRTPEQLELALCLTGGDDDLDEERRLLEAHGWRVTRAWELTASPDDYRAYVQASRGEFSCVKPSCVRLQNAWISDRTLCYLASGKPAVIQHTGPSRFLPDSAGLFRFHDPGEAVRCLEAVRSDYEHHCRLARQLAEQHFDAEQVVGSVLERALS